MSSIALKRYEVKKLISNRYNCTENAVKISKGNTFEHELSKFLVCWEILQQDNAFLTECIFNTGKRCDILNLDSATAIEILMSETREQFEKKVLGYPVDVIGLQAEDTIEKQLRLFLPSWKISRV